MREHEVIVVGGGPAGSSAAWELTRKGADCLVLDREVFPRHKLCAGWVTPEVLADLEVGENDYPHGLLTFDKLKVKLKGLPYGLATCQHSIRRYEFDAWLLERSRAPVEQHEVKRVVDDGEHFVLDDAYRCRHLIGAGGTRCPVHRALFRPEHPHPKPLQCVTLELEYEYPWQDPDCHLWFCDHGLPGYSWYVPKANGYLNVGVGGAVEKLHARGDSIARHWQALGERLVDEGLVEEPPAEAKGYSYFLRDRDDCGRRGRAYVAGDAAGLATRDMCEGIGPAVKSGLLAAQSILRECEYDLGGVEAFTLANSLVARGLQRVLVPAEYRL